ncbi:hypothetical protein Scep_028478 [Stephania cephalantha]|uniref:Uncharacterized protein n=1 Tax=Stephania cephalantha TaxID=152367 RepID=A0AAP0EA12_9MAGN
MSVLLESPGGIGQHACEPQDMPQDADLVDCSLVLGILSGRIREFGEVGERCETYGLGWTPSGSRHRHSGARAGDVAGSSRPISAPNGPIELLRRDFKQMQTNILRVMQDNALTRDELREVQGQLRLMEQALMDRLEISFTPPRDVPDDDSETDDDPDD